MATNYNWIFFYLNSLPIFQLYLTSQNPIDHKMIKG
jgi:hypothetical protein